MRQQVWCLRGFCHRGWGLGFGYCNGESRPGASPHIGFPSSAPQITGDSVCVWGDLSSSSSCQGYHAAELAHPCHPEPPLPGTAGQPAAVSRLLIPRNKSRSLMQLEEEKSRALSREQQTLWWIPLLPARLGALRPPHLRHPGFVLAAFGQ